MTYTPVNRWKIVFTAQFRGYHETTGWNTKIGEYLVEYFVPYSPETDNEAAAKLWAEQRFNEIGYGKSRVYNGKTVVNPHGPHCYRIEQVETAH